jgi:hypothetical protein
MNYIYIYIEEAALRRRLPRRGTPSAVELLSQNGYGMAEDPFSRKASHLHKATIGEPEGFVSPEGNETGRKFVDVRDSGGPGGPMDPDPAPQREPRGGHINPRERGGGHPGSPAKLTTITKQTVIYIYSEVHVGLRIELLLRDGALSLGHRVSDGQAVGRRFCRCEGARGPARIPKPRRSSPHAQNEPLQPSL